ncbi:MAG: hypothetical protein FWF86_05550 [Clostridia bacterium]|nr:hypothetical protein [Clostridia bacterium]
MVLTACSGSRDVAYQKAVDLFASGDFEAAAAAFDRLGDYQQAPTYAAYSTGLVLFEKEDYIGAEPYFEKSQAFMYGKARYDICRAYGLQQAGHFAAAAALFGSLGAFENAPQAYHYCLGRAAEGAADYESCLYAYPLAAGYADADDRLADLQYQIYTRAMQIKVEAVTSMEDPGDLRPGITEDFQNALTFFTILGDYQSSRIHAGDCVERLRQLRYDEAEAQERDGQFQEAYESFLALSGFSDAAGRAEELASRLGILIPDEE